MGFYIRTTPRGRAHFLSQQGWYAACMILAAPWQHLHMQLMINTCGPSVSGHSATSTESFLPYAEQQQGKQKPLRIFECFLELTRCLQKHYTYSFVTAGKLPPNVVRARRFRSVLSSSSARHGAALAGLSASQLATQVSMENIEIGPQAEGGVGAIVLSALRSMPPIFEENVSSVEDSIWSDPTAENQESTLSSEDRDYEDPIEEETLPVDEVQALRISLEDTHIPETPVGLSHNGENSAFNEGGRDESP